MLTHEVIREFLEKEVKKGTTLHINEIQELIKRNFELTEEDWEPHTDTRPTRYPNWKQNIQTALNSMKKAETIKNHDDITHTYTF